MGQSIKKLLAQMSLEEKASLCSGLDFWHTKGIERLGIPSIMLADGPHGLRKQRAQGKERYSITSDSVPATCFPSGAGLASTWNRKLIERVGEALGAECLVENVNVLLGPGANIKRSPLCGRNFEYFSEDPYLSGEMAKHHIMGVQKMGVGTSLKHFVANNQEHRRMSIDVRVNERALREIYLASFEGAIKGAKPWGLMTSYNKVNGVYVSENAYFLTKILREEWKYDGMVMSDWGGVNERVDALVAGLELEMPSSNGERDKFIVNAIKNGVIDETILNRAVERIISFIHKTEKQKQKKCTSINIELHHLLAKEVATESMVLLKNEDRILPLKKEGIIAVVGALVKQTRYQGGGSSNIKATRLDEVITEIENKAGPLTTVTYAKGYHLESDDSDHQLIDEAILVASEADVVLLFVGLPERFESEGYDREHLQIPRNQQRIIEDISKIQPNIVIILCNGAPVEMPWISNVKGLLEAYLGGQALGGALAELLFGNVNPSGKLAETFPKKLSDTPAFINFPGEIDTVEYGEGIFVGYRYYDAKKIEPLFPFGYGLSYTTFSYLNCVLSQNEIDEQELLFVYVTIKNTGELPGKEVVQLYVNDVVSTVRRPEKELKGFEKVALQPGEEKTITFTLDRRAFAYYNVKLQSWYVESGVFEILIGGSSRDIFLSEKVKVKSSEKTKTLVHRNTTVGEILDDPRYTFIIKEFLAQASEQNILSVLSESNNVEMVEAMMKDMPLRALVNFSHGDLSEELLVDIIELLNGIK